MDYVLSFYLCGYGIKGSGLSAKRLKTKNIWIEYFKKDNKECLWKINFRNLVGRVFGSLKENKTENDEFIWLKKFNTFTI